MAKSSAERQAEFRQRHLKAMDGQMERLNVLISVTGKRKLERLAACYGVTQRAMLERLLETQERDLLSGLTSDQQAAYYEERFGVTA